VSFDEVGTLLPIELCLAVHWNIILNQNLGPDGSDCWAFMAGNLNPPPFFSIVVHA